MQPSLMPFTPEDFDLCEAEAARMFPALAGRMRPSDPERSLNGMFSFTPDAGSIVGESATVRGVWVCEAVWVTHAGGHGAPGRSSGWWPASRRYDLAEADANRFYPFQTTRALRDRARASSSTARSTTSSTRASSRRSRADLRLTPFYARHEELGASFVTGAGWERPQWFEANRDARRRRDPRVGAPRRVGGARVVADRGRRAPRGARDAPGCSTSRRT